jgi:predicted dehydrogenase
MTGTGPVRCAVIGVGMIGAPHAAVLAGSPLAELIGCCDTDPAAAGRLPPGVPLTTDLDELLDHPDLEAVFVCTPQETHREIASRALDTDLFVFCEKPIAHTLADADALIEQAAGRPGRLAIGHLLRFDPDYLAVYRAVRAGAIGRIVSIAARRCVPDFEGRLISGRTTLPVEVGVHDIDILQWLAGDVEAVHAEAARLGVTGPGRIDAVAGTLRFASGAVGVLELDWIMPSASPLRADYRLAAFGTSGSAFAEFHAPTLRLFGGNAARTARPDEVYGSHIGALRTEDEHFLRTVRGTRTWPLTPQDARSALVVALALDRSALLGRPVRIAGARHIAATSFPAGR